MRALIHNLLGNLFGFEHPETVIERRFFHVFEAFVVTAAMILAWSWALYLRHLPGTQYPLGLANYINLSLLYGDAYGLALAGAVSVCGLTGFCIPRFRLAYPMALLLLHLLYVARFSMGKVGHGSNIVGMCLLGLAVAALWFQEGPGRRRFALGFAYFFSGLGYVLAASCKLVGTGLSWPDGRHLVMWMAERSIDVLSMSGALHPSLVQQFIGSHVGWGTTLLLGGLLAEGLGWLLWYRRTRPFITAALVAMHIGITLVLSIRFDLNVVVLLFLGISWPRLLERFRAWLLSVRAEQHAL